MIETQIEKLKKEKNAIILAHFYQHGDIQDIADFVGDSLALAKKAAKTDADVIVFCGVRFMAETAKILSPEKTVLQPVRDAGCAMANMIDAEALSEHKKKHPEQKIICYVNTHADIKALSDVCVTSSSAAKIVRHFEDDPLLYVPDKNLGAYLRDTMDLDMELWPGHCYIHNNLTVQDVETKRKQYPDAEILVHPEAPLDVLKRVDFVGSTSQILSYATQADGKMFVIGTDKGLLHPLRKNNPDKTFVLLNEGLSCRDMKLTRLEDVKRALEHHQYEITVDETIAAKAKHALDQMIELS